MEEKKVKTKQQCFELVFDWMMEAASLLKMTKNGFYRAMMIFEQICELDGRIVNSKKLSHFVCGALSLGAKFECSGPNFVERIHLINSKKISKEDIGLAEFYILEVINKILRFFDGKCLWMCR